MYVNIIKSYHYFNYCKINLFYFILILVENETLSKEVTALGFPLEHKHKLCCLRQELIDAFVDSRYMMFIKYAAFHLQQLSIKKQEEKNSKQNKTEKQITNSNIEKENDMEQSELEAAEAKKIVESITDGNKQECKLFN